MSCPFDYVFALDLLALSRLYLTYESAPLSLDNPVGLINRLGDPTLAPPAAVWIPLPGHYRGLVPMPQIATVVPDARLATVVMYSIVYVYVII